MLWTRSTKMPIKYFLIFWVILNFTIHSLLFMGVKSWQELINSHMLEWHVFQCLIKISWNLETSDVTKDLFVFKCGFCWVKDKYLLGNTVKFLFPLTLPRDFYKNWIDTCKCNVCIKNEIPKFARLGVHFSKQS